MLALLARTASQVPPNSNLVIKATLDHPLPLGWKLIVFHNGDPQSQGNGVYYILCNLVGSATDKSPPECGDTRKTLPAPGDDFVTAQLLSPTALVFNIQIYVPVR